MSDANPTLMVIGRRMISEFRSLLRQLTDDERKELFDEFSAGYCHECGADLGPEGRCFCRRDD